jgi:cell wall assembly regulator SMI1
MNIEDLWFDLEQWLSKHCTELDGVLRAGASPNLIDSVERRLGVTFPAEVRTFYQCHDGQTDDSPGLFEGFQFLSLAEVISEWSIWQDQDSKLYPAEMEMESPTAPEIKPGWWNPAWVPFTANGCGDNQCIDLDPTESGSRGQILSMWLVPPDRTRMVSSKSRTKTEPGASSENAT